MIGATYTAGIAHWRAAASRAVDAVALPLRAKAEGACKRLWLQMPYSSHTGFD